jgi:hypothetical protein
MRLLQVIMGNKSWSFVLSSKAICSGLASLIGSTQGLFMFWILQISARTFGDLGDESRECSDAECGRMPVLSVFSGETLVKKRICMLD